MDLGKHFESITAELSALQNRVRHFIDDAHWQTDGEWKESALRYVLRRNIPTGIQIGRGFVVHPKYRSTQIDLILYDSTIPVLFQDGDLVIVSAQAVKAIVEVKTGIDASQLRIAASKLADISSKVNEISGVKPHVGLFVYDDAENVQDATVLQTFSEVAGVQYERVINLACIGKSHFFRWWEHTYTPPPIGFSERQWTSYHTRNMAPGYFLHNLLGAVCPNSVGIDPDTWFPEVSKEIYVTGNARFRG